MYKPIKHKLCSLCTHPRHWLQRTSLPCASEVSCTTEENILWEKGRRNHGKCLYLSLHTVNLISKGSKWWVTSRITAGQKKALSINERTGAEVKEEASIIQITYLHLIDVSYIRLCSSLFFFLNDFLDVTVSGMKVELLAKIVILQDQRHGWACPFLSVKSIDFFLSSWHSSKKYQLKNF